MITVLYGLSVDYLYPRKAARNILQSINLRCKAVLGGNNMAVQLVLNFIIIVSLLFVTNSYTTTTLC